MHSTFLEFKISARSNAGMQRWRRAVRTLLLWTSLVVFLLLGLSGVLLGSMGVDVHWTSK